MDVSKLISTSPLEYQSQKLNYSVLLTELNADLGFIDGSGTTNTVPKFTVSGTIGDSTIIDNGVNYLLSLLSTNGFVKTSGGTGQLSVSSQVSATEGGTGRGSWTAGSLPYISATNTFNELAAGTNGYYLSMVAGVPAWAAVSAPNLGSANLTSADDARTFTLKSGGTATQNLQFLNSGGGNLLTLYGNKAIDFGSSANTIKPKIYLDAYAPDKFSLFSNVSSFSFCDVYSDGNGQFDLKNLNGNVKIEMNAGVGSGAYLEKAEMNLRGAYSSFRIFNSIANNAVELTSGSADYGQLYLNSVSGANKTYLSASYSIIDTSLKVGGSFAGATAALQIVGAGSTSATTTALFQNSSSVAALKVKDDGYCILKANNAAIASGDLANNEMSFYIDEGTNHCVVKVKYSSGTVKTGTFNLT
jgi:hypothetical protein